MNAAELRAIRDAAGLSQAEMAALMGLGFRAYQGIETGPVVLKARHVALAERASLTLALRLKNPMLAAARIRQDALDLARLLRGD